MNGQTENSKYYSVSRLIDSLEIDPSYKHLNVFFDKIYYNEQYDSCSIKVLGLSVSNNSSHKLLKQEYPCAYVNVKQNENRKVSECKDDHLYKLVIDIKSKQYKEYTYYPSRIEEVDIKYRGMIDKLYAEYRYVEPEIPDAELEYEEDAELLLENL